MAEGQGVAEEVPPGYKRTEVGVVPEEWTVKRIGDLIAEKGGSSKTGPFGTLLKASEYSTEGVPIVSVSEIGFGKLEIKENTPMAPPDVVRRLPEYCLKPGDIVFGRKGAVERSAIIETHQEGWFLGSDGIRLRLPPSVHPPFIAHQLQSLRICKWLISNSVGTTMASLNQDVLSQVILSFPPLPEQRAIAAALSDADGLIEALDALIEKKRAIKQAAMQQLLTGKKRLPGFEGKWEVKRLGDIITFLPTANKPRADLSDDGEIQYIHYGDVHAQTKPILNCNVCTLPYIDREKVGNAAYLEDSDLVIVDASEDLEGTGKSVEIQGISGRSVIAGLHTILCRGNPDQWTKGFKAYLQFIPVFKSALTRIATGISVYAISKKQIAEIELALPSVPEQEAIVSILSDMDAEIAALKRRRDKTNQVKQGMMQELLTGRTRLIDPPEAPA